MSSYNNIEKIKYASEDCVVNLEEYIIFENERAEEKYVVFKFANNVNQQLLGMEFEVSQYDVENNLVEKSVVIYNKFLAKPVQSFVPKAKLKVNYACKTLSVRLIQAAFDRFVWKEGQFLDNSYKFEHYARDEDTEAAKRNPPAPPVKVKAQNPAPAPKRRKGKIPFTAKNSTRKNIAKFPKVLNFILLILALVAIGVGVYFFAKKSTSFIVDNFHYEITDEGAKTVTVTGYDGADKNITIPATVNDYTVARIKEKAFKGSDIESVKFNSTKLYIESYAFADCASLKTVTSPAETTVHSYAFENCKKLTTVSLPNAALLKNSFNGCTGVTHLSYGSIATGNIADAFGGTLPKDITVVVGEEKPTGGGDGGGEEFVYNPEETYDYGYLADKNVNGYLKYKDFETVNDVIITINPETTSLVVPSGISGISENVYSKAGNVYSLSVYDDCLLTTDVMEAFSNVEGLDIQNHDSQAEPVNLNHFNKLHTLIIPCYKNDLVVNMYGLPQQLNELSLRCTEQCKIIPDGAFYGVNAQTIGVIEGFTACGTNILGDYNQLVYSLTLPKGVTYGEGTIGENCSLAYLDIYLENFDTAYQDINKSYANTSTLILHTSRLTEDGFGYLSEVYTNIANLYIYAENTDITLAQFVCGANTPDMSCPKANCNIKYLDDYTDFLAGYPEYD